MEVILITLALTAVAVALLLWFFSKDHYIYGFFKMFASTGFIVLCVASGGIHSVYGCIILGGLVLSWWGDLFLVSRGKTIFMLGLIAFFLAHVCYCTAFVFYGVGITDTILVSVIMLIPGVIIMRWLHPHLGTMKIPVYGYIIVISVMTALSVSAAYTTGGFLIPCGAVFFYCSDIFVARDRFVAPGRINAYIGLPLYYGGQVLLALTPLYVS